ncbi:MAG: T9SS type A sorting domain-containing protein [Flavobacteriales bacterium]
MKTILFGFILLSLTVTATAQTFVASIVSESGITSSNLIIGAPDGSGAQLYENGDVITVQLDATIPSGTPYFIRWKKRIGESGNARPLVRESSTGGSWTDNANLCQSSSTEFVTTQYVAGIATNYLQITKTSAYPADFEIDAVITLSAYCNAAVSQVCEITGYETATGRIVWIPNFGTDFRANAEIGLNLVKYANGRAHLTGIVERISDPSKQFLVNIWFNNESDYASWLLQGNIAHSPELGDESTWTFYDFDLSYTNQMIGLGTINNQLLNIYPQVSSGSINPCSLLGFTFNLLSNQFQYGLQLGQGANALNGGFGLSSWFVYDGTQCGSGDYNGGLQNCSTTCNNVTSGGTIGSAQSGCSPFTPNTLTNIAWPTGGSGNIEYMWLYKNASTNWQLTTIAGASAASYTPSALTETTTFRRCARRQGCTAWNGESNDVTVTVNSCGLTIPTAECTGDFVWEQQISLNPNGCEADVEVRFVDGGYVWVNLPSEMHNANVYISNVHTISWDGYCGRENVSQSNEKWKVFFYRNGSVVGQTGYTTDILDNVISNTKENDFGPFAFPNGVDQIKLVHYEDNQCNGSDWNSANSVVPVAVCLSYTATPNCNNVTDGGSICCDQTGCLPSFDPAPINNYTYPSGGSGTIEYMWLYKNATTNWQWVQILNAFGDSYDPGVITENTTFRRCSRRSNCTSWDGESNDVTITLGNCCDGIELDIWDNSSSCQICNESFTSSITTAYINGNKDIVEFTDPNCGNGQCLVGLTVTFNVAAADFDLSQNSSYVDQVSYNYPIELNGVVIGYFNPTELPYTCNVCEPNSNKVKTYYFNAEDVNYNYGGLNTLDVNFRDFGLQQGQVQDVCVGNILLDFIWGTCCETEAPVFTFVPEDETVECAGEIPSLEDAVATDNSGETPTITYSETIVNTGEPTQVCEISNANDHTLWVASELANALGCSSVNFISEGTGTFEVFPDGTAKLTGTVKNASSSTKKFQYEVWYHLKRNYDEWTAIPNAYTASGFREPKLDAGTTVTIGDRYLDWFYYEMDTSKPHQLVGVGNLSGVVLQLSHMPSNMSFAAQLGDRASLQSTGYGFSAWVNIEGSINGSWVSSHGDFNVDLNNCVDTPSEPTCADTYQIIRTWTATDNCDNSATASQTITVLGDTEAPVFVNVPESSSSACGALPNAADFNVSATDNCDSDVTVTVSVVNQGNEAECNASRTFTWTATDDCGNSVSVSRTFTISDNEAPVFDMEVEDMTIQCQNSIPDAADMTATDNCDTDVEVIYEEVISSDNSNESTCEIHDANAGHTLWVSNPVKNALGCSSNNFISTGFGTFTKNADGTLTVTGLVQNTSNASKKFQYTAHYRFKRNYAEWTAIPNGSTASGFREAKLDAGTTITIGNEYLNWEYYEMDPTQSNVLVGVDALAGTTLNITHAPADYSFGAQLGENASLQSYGYGFSAWIIITGSVNGTPVADQGDFNFSLTNCQDEPSTTECSDTYQIVRTWTAIDNCGNSTTATQTIQVTGDTEAPTFDNLPENNTVYCDELPEGEELGVTASDNCDVSVIVTVSHVDAGEGCNLTRTYTWVATDDCGNQTTASRTFSVNDDEAPVFVNLPENGEVLCGQLPDPANYYVDAEDNCTANPVVTFSVSDEGTGCEQTRTITWTATDACGNQATATRTFYLSDNEAPVLVNVPANTTMECGEEAPNAEVFATDNCDQDVEVDMVATTEMLDCGYNFIRTWTAIDDCGNMVEATQVITFTDSTNPVISWAPENATYECNTTVPYNEPVFSDVCDSDLEVSFEEVQDPATCGYVINRTWTATDDCGNSASYTQIITIVDTTAPVLEGVPANITVECDNVPAISDAVTAFDSCDGALEVFVSEGFEPMDCGYLLTRTWSATDACGNVSYGTQVLTVVDTTNPEIHNVPANAVVSCDNIPSVNMDVYASDNCDVNVALTFVENIIPGTPGTADCTYSIERVWTATDNCGNSVSASQVLTVIDNVAPVLVGVPANTDAECSNIPAAPFVYATDNCTEGQIMTSMSEQIIPMGACSYQLVRTWTAVDNCSNMVTATQTITVVDTTAPEFVNAPANVTVECGQVPSVPTVEANDACDSMVDVEFFEMSTTGCPYTITRVWAAFDDCGNTATHTQVITVVDTQAPYVVNGVEAELTIGCNDVVPTDMPSFGDACDNMVDISAISGINNVSPCGYDIERAWTATDDCGNAFTVYQVIHVIDNENPTLVGVPANATVACDQIPAAADVTATDACSSATVSMTEEVSEGCPYTITRTWTATDVCGNSSSAVQVITVIDEVAPTFVNTPANITVECDNIPTAADVTAIDNCTENVVVTMTESSTSGWCTYYIFRTYTATDACGNSAEFTQTITVTDTTNPVLIGVPANVTVDCNSIPEPAVVTATDNCADNLDVNMVEDILPQDCGYLIVRSWAVHDHCNNTTVQTQVITVIDTNGPEATFTPEDITAECSDEVPYVAAMFADNCSDVVSVTYADEVMEGDCAYDIVRTWTAMDACGNYGYASQTIHVVDTTAPVFDATPENITVECDNVPTPVVLTATDNCNEVEISYSEVIIPGEPMMGDMPCGYTIERTWTATDACGNASYFTQVVTVVDTTAPVLMGVPSNITVECDAIPTPADVYAVDNCDTFDMEVVLTETILPIDGCSYMLIRTWTVEDNCWNYATDSQIITVIDTTAPVFEGEDSEMTLECNIQPSVIAPAVSDNCDQDVEVEFTYTEIAGDCENSYDGIYTWVATDDCGNTATRTMTFHFVDTTAPTFTYAPENITVECSDMPALPIATAVDNCDADVELTYNEVVGTGCPYTITRTWTATDNCGNTAVHTQVVTVVDTTNPVLIGVPADATIECTEMLPPAFVTATDNCSEDMLVSMTSSSEVNECETIVTRTWSVTDDCGNTASASQVVTIVDTTAPYIIDAPASEITVECSDEVPAFNPTFGDACDTELSIFAISGINNVSDCGYDIERSVTAMDNCGNAVTASQVVHVVDTTAPVFTSLPENMTVECSAIPTAMELEATDNCSEVSISYNEAVEAIDNCAYEITRTWTASDVCGNETVATQVLTVVDTTAPVFVETPQNMEVSCDAIPSVAIVTATDLCDTNVEVTFSENSTEGCPYTITRTWTAMDDCGNTTIHTQVLTVVDNVNPILVGVPANITIECDEEVPSYQVYATDNCTDMGEVSFTSSTEMLDCGYEITNTWSATDNCGNSVSASQVITVVDTTAPYIVSAPASEITVECSDEIPAFEPVFGDNCDMELEYSAISGYNNVSSCGYDIERSVTATDDCGNMVTAYQVVHVVDTTAPVFVNAPSNITVECDNIPAPVSVTAFDNCSGVAISMVETSTEGCPYIITRTWTATDECGNEASVSQVLTVVDTTLPVLIGVPADATVECDNVPAAAVVSANDNCSTDLQVVFAEGFEPMECGYQLTRIWSATDACGNTATATQVLTVVDTTAPYVVDAPAAEITVECSDEVPAFMPEFADNCDMELTITAISGINNVTDCGYDIERTVTATDNCGNSVSASQVVHIVDTTAPVFVEIPQAITVECDQVPAPLQLMATDNCDEMVEITVSEVATEGCPYVITRTYTATDNCGNSTSFEHVITVVDTTNPVLVNVPENVTIECTEDLPGFEVSATDNCSENLEVMMTSSTEVFECGSEVTRTWTVSDACGNTASATQVITIVDTTAPYIVSTPAAEITVECSDEIPSFEPTFADACDAELTYSAISGINNVTNCGYDIERSVTATDNCGNSVTASQVVHIVDTTAPVVTGEIEITAACDANVGTLITVTDNCDANPTITYEDFLVSGGSCAGRVIRNYTVTDICGNSSTFEQIIWLTDETAPVALNQPEDMVVECDATIPEASVEFMDNCDDELEFNYTSTTELAECGYTITRVWTATDNCGNTTTVDQVITVTDTTAPVLYNVPANIELECGTEIPAASMDVYASDNCATDIQIFVTDVTVELECGYQINREYRAADACGNIALGVQVITIVDTTAPVFDTTVESLTVMCENVPPVPVVTAHDTCDGLVNIEFTQDWGTGCPYTITRTWVATDACGNESILIQEITVIDEVAPQFINNPVWIQIECSDFAGYTLEAIDNCDDEVEVQIVEELVFSGGCFGNIQRTYHAIDNCGNVTEFIQIIHLVDTQAPVISGVPTEEVTIFCEGEVPAMPELVSAIDNCDAEVDIYFEETQTNEFCPYDIIRTWTAVDECGNETVASQVIHVVVEVPVQMAALNAYPNPTNGDFTFEFSNPHNAKAFGAIYDVTGKEVIRLLDGNIDGGRLYKKLINGDKLNAGTYTIMVKVGDEILRNRIIITGN